MSPRILLVDDEPNIRKMVGALLESEGFETAEAAVRWLHKEVDRPQIRVLAH